MEQTTEAVNVVDAVYEDGVFRPLTPLNGSFTEGQHVRLSIAVTPDSDEDPLGMLTNFYEGMSEEEIQAIEKIMLDRSHWRIPRDQ